MVPTHTFKEIYDPGRQEAGAYLVDNAPGAKPAVLSIAQLEEMVGMNLFPAVKENIKSMTSLTPP